jgi:hypothetical protein
MGTEERRRLAIDARDILASSDALEELLGIDPLHA